MIDGLDKAFQEVKESPVPKNNIIPSFVKDMPEPKLTLQEADRIADGTILEHLDVNDVSSKNEHIISDADSSKLDKTSFKIDGVNENDNPSNNDEPEYNEISDSPFDKNGELRPNCTYESNGYTYYTDDQGRIVKVEGNLHLEDGKRNTDAQKKAGGEDRREGDQGGHLIAREFGGSGKLDNLVAMKGELNQGEYKKLENELAKALNDGKSVTVNIDVKYDGKSERPSKIIVTYTIDGESFTKVFNNN